MTDKSKKRILCVCIENSNRSQMAEALARIHGGEVVDAYSAGSRPSGVVNPKAIDAMKEKGYDLTRHRSKSLDEVSAGECEASVSMGCGDACPMVQAKRRMEWDIPDPKTLPPEEFASVRNLIEKEVIELLESL